MTSKMTQAERLTRIETLLEGWLETRKDDRSEWAAELRKIHERLDDIEEQHRATNARLAAYENKGKGLLIGAAIAGGGLVGGIVTAWEKLKEIFL